MIAKQSATQASATRATAQPRRGRRSQSAMYTPSGMSERPTSSLVSSASSAARTNQPKRRASSAQTAVSSSGVASATAWKSQSDAPSTAGEMKYATANAAATSGSS